MNQFFNLSILNSGSIIWRISAVYPPNRYQLCHFNILIITLYFSFHQRNGIKNVFLGLSKWADEVATSRFTILLTIGVFVRFVALFSKHYIWLNSLSSIYFIIISRTRNWCRENRSMTPSFTCSKRLWKIWIAARTRNRKPYTRRNRSPRKVY